VGGVGASGMGAYHGFEGFRTFSHYKSIMEKATWLELWFLKTPPYKKWKLSIMRFLMEKL
jgi:aldehyde dehydrogenase (NAD+)